MNRVLDKLCIICGVNWLAGQLDPNNPGIRAVCILSLAFDTWLFTGWSWIWYVAPSLACIAFTHAYMRRTMTAPAHPALTETPEAWANKYLASINHPADTWTVTANHLVDEYLTELVATPRRTENRRQTAWNATVTRFEESLTDVS